MLPSKINPVRLPGSICIVVDAVVVVESTDIVVVVVIGAESVVAVVTKSIISWNQKV